MNPSARFGSCAGKTAQRTERPCPARHGSLPRRTAPAADSSPSTPKRRRPRGCFRPRQRPIGSIVRSTLPVQDRFKARTANASAPTAWTLKEGHRGVHTLYAVHHGGRESVELFELDTRKTPIAIAWIGCVVAPDPIGLNAVVALPDGGFAATNFDPRQAPGGRGGFSPALTAGERNGEVWEWHQRSGWAKVPGSEGSWSERDRALAGRPLVLHRGVGQPIVHAAVARKDAAGAAGNPARVSGGQRPLRARRQAARRWPGRARRRGNPRRQQRRRQPVDVDHRPHRSENDDLHNDREPAHERTPQCGDGRDPHR